ncbi:MAG TPA: phosphatase PAP2 family protein [Pyrinomonadaceae bacterium]|nr:phosphatase PAP2 family protein [Pyrinomonadaceae bacterium]
MSFTNRSISLSSISVPVFILAVCLSAAAQTPSPTPLASPTPTLEHEFFKNVLRDQKAIWTAPFHLHSKDARWLAPIGLGTAALISTDQQTGDEMAESTGQLNASRIVSYAGSTYGVGAVAGAFYIAGRAGHDPRARETGVLGAEALIDSAIVVTTIKEITQRTRPSGGRSRSDFFDGGSSFPSGHSIEAWSLATVIAHEYHGHPAVQIAAYGIASAVSVARFTGQKHYLSDVLVGSAMGFGIGRYVYRAHHQTKSNSGGGNEEDEETLSESRQKRSIFVSPIYSHTARAYGLAATWSF